MRRPSLIITMFLVLGPGSALAGTTMMDGITYEFVEEERTYTLHGMFFVEAEPDCLADILYAFEHLDKFVRSADSIELVRQGKNWYEVRYGYRMLLYTNTYTYRKELRDDRRKITFHMVASTQRGLLLPEVLTSSGHYTIAHGEDGCRVEYMQTNSLGAGLLAGAYKEHARKEGITFLQELREYLERTCD